MAQKTVLLTINHAPHGSAFCAEGLRTAMGILSATDDHSVTVVYLGEGAYGGLADMQRGETAGHIATLAELGCRLGVENESLQKTGIRTDEVAPDVEVIPRTELLALVDAADFVIDF